MSRALRPKLPRPGLGKAVKALTKRFDDLNDRFRQLAAGMAKQLAGLNANQQVHAEVLEKLDVNTQVLAQMIKNLYGKLEQVDVFIARISEYPNMSVELTDLSSQDAKEIKDRADEIFNDVMRDMFRQIHEERKAAMEEHRLAAEKEKEEAAEAEKAKKEAEQSEEALQATEQEIVGEPGGEGSSIPEGAEVFGG